MSDLTMDFWFIYTFVAPFGRFRFEVVFPSLQLLVHRLTGTVILPGFGIQPRYDFIALR